MPRLLLRIAYDGTAYAGWQRQQNGPSIQACLETALAPLAGGLVTVHGAGRTDAGVHAEGQVAHVDLPDGLLPDTVLRAANARLPTDIRVREVRQVSNTLHARFDALSKTYRYRWLVSTVGHPLLARTSTLVPPPLDASAMDQACAGLIGTHDFAAFRSTGTRVATTTRTITMAQVQERAGDPRDVAVLAPEERLVEFEVAGDGFLRHMVRALAGTLLAVGQGRAPASGLASVLAGRTRQEAGPTAPAHGLTLIHVAYRLE
ncbi:MAG: tRNA pseudouridine(38-40) synthase TruA [Luteitalea sp.]|nr:tRNA pseudouridine(38-40) synthase TruA [Acidobacteriota bacterium]